MHRSQKCLEKVIAARFRQKSKEYSPACGGVGEPVAEEVEACQIVDYVIQIIAKNSYPECYVFE